MSKSINIPSSTTRPLRRPTDGLAQNTLSRIPSILTSTTSNTSSTLYTPSTLPAITCPSLPKTKIRIFNADTFDTAISMLRAQPSKPVCVLNLANPYVPGGGWLHGAMAQEEQLCYRSTLIGTLHERYYPLPDISAVYSPKVGIFRGAFPGYEAYEDGKEVEVVSVISVAGLIMKAGDVVDGGTRYRKERDRKTMEEKIRMVVRVAAAKGKRRIVLGALGCGAFGNPPVEVAEMWKRVLREFEGWWEEVVFAVYVPPGQEAGRAGENLMVFEAALEGVEV